MLIICIAPHIRCVELLSPHLLYVVNHLVSVMLSYPAIPPHRARLVRAEMPIVGATPTSVTPGLGDGGYNGSTSKTPISIPYHCHLALSDGLLRLTKGYSNTSVVNPAKLSATNWNPFRPVGGVPPNIAAHWFHSMSKLHQTVETVPGIHLRWR